MKNTNCIEGLSRWLLLSAATLVCGMACKENNGLATQSEAAQGAPQPNPEPAAPKEPPKDEGPPLRPKVIDESLVARVLGEFTPIEGEAQYFNLSVTADRIRCNHSNHSDEYTSHEYAVARAIDNTVVLVAAGGNLVVKLDDGDEKYSFSGNGICPWGIRGPYRRTLALNGQPPELLPSGTRTKRGAFDAEVGKEVQLIGGAVTLAEAKHDVWSGDDGDTSVLALKLSFQAPEGVAIDPMLASDLADIAGTEGHAFRASCGNSDSRGLGNPAFKTHREPKIDSGVYTAFGGHRDTLVRKGRVRSGWVTLLMTGQFEGVCKVTFDSVGLGGGLITWNVDVGSAPVDTGKPKSSSRSKGGADGADADTIECDKSEVRRHHSKGDNSFSSREERTEAFRKLAEMGCDEAADALYRIADSSLNKIDVRKGALAHLALFTSDHACKKLFRLTDSSLNPEPLRVAGVRALKESSDCESYVRRLTLATDAMKREMDR
jgi:hypothetical protein